MTDPERSELRRPETKRQPLLQEIVPAPSILETVLAFCLSPRLYRFYILLFILLLLYLFILPVLSFITGMWQNMSSLPAQQAQKFTEQIYDKVVVEDFLLTGLENADHQSVQAHIDRLLEQQFDEQAAPPTVIELDLALLHSGLQQHPWIVDARITRMQTGHFLVDVQEHVPVAVFEDSLKQKWLINDKGHSFVLVTGQQAEKFTQLLQIKGPEAYRFVPELLESRSHLPLAFQHLVRADRQHFPGWKLWYRRTGALGKDQPYYIYVHGNDSYGLSASLKTFLQLEQTYKLSHRAVRGYDLRAFPKLRIDFLPSDK